MNDQQLTLDLQTVKPEEWRPVVGYEGLYEVSDHGRVRSLDRIVCYRASSRSSGHERLQKGQLIAQINQSTGYYNVGLGRNGSVAVRSVHTLVLEAFLGPRPPGYHACHYDGNPKNNDVANLRWDTQKANGEDKTRHGRSLRGERNGNSKLADSDVVRMRTAYIAVAKATRRQRIAFYNWWAAELGIHRKSVSRLVHNWRVR